MQTRNWNITAHRQRDFYQEASYSTLHLPFANPAISVSHWKKQQTKWHCRNFVGVTYEESFSVCTARSLHAQKHVGGEHPEAEIGHHPLHLPKNKQRPAVWPAVLQPWRVLSRKMTRSSHFFYSCQSPAYCVSQERSRLKNYQETVPSGRDFCFCSMFYLWRHAPKAACLLHNLPTRPSTLCYKPAFSSLSTYKFPKRMAWWGPELHFFCTAALHCNGENRRASPAALQGPQVHCTAVVICLPGQGASGSVQDAGRDREC